MSHAVRSSVRALPRRLLLAAGLGLLALGAQAQTALDNITKAKTIKIAIPTDYPPYGFVGPDMKPQGLDVAMAELIAAKLGVKVELVPVTSANRIPYLQTKKADLVISTLGKNPEREKVIAFSSAYAPFYQAVFAPKSLAIKSFADLAGKSVAVTRGAMEDQELAKVAPSTLEFKRFEDNNATIAAFAAGQTQVLATSAAVAGNLMQRQPGLNVEYKLLLKDSPCFIGVAKGEDALLAKVNAIIAAAKEYNWEIDKGAVAKIWRAGCIIRAQFLNRIVEAYERNPNLTTLLEDEYFARAVADGVDAWRRIVSVAALSGVPVPGFSAALSYYDSLSVERLPAALIQGQRDFFGAHTYKRVDKEGVYHTLWSGDRTEVRQDGH